VADDASMVWSPVDEEWILQVPGRRNLAPRADLAPDDPRGVLCPFCPASPEAPVAGRVHAVPSKHPMVVGSNHGSDGRIGRHWVLVYGDSHDKRLGDLPASVTTEFVALIALKTKHLFETEDVKSIFAFESVGNHFGPTVAHPHGQLVGLPFVPRRLSLASDECPFCKVRAGDCLQIVRIGSASLEVAPWSRFPFEMLAIPEVHHPTLMSLNLSEIKDLAACVHIALKLAVDTHGGRMPPYLINFMQGAQGDNKHHIRVEIVPLHKDAQSLKRPGGMELGLGVYLNPVLPGDAVAILREALERRNGQ
jgi:UDPglucose--hexose-1-phosphate uridylyltransferase